MADQSVPRKNQAYVLRTTLVSQADANLMQDPPTLAAGDVEVSTDGGALAASTNAPVTNPVGSVVAEVTLTAAEMNGDVIVVFWHDAAGAEWQDQTWILHPSDDTLPVLSTEIAAVAGDVWDEARVGHAGGGTFGEGAASVQGNVTGSVGSVAAGGVTAASFAANAVDANALALDAAEEIADTTLGRNLATVAGAAGRSLLNAVRFLRNRRRSAGGLLTVYEEDDATVAWQGAVTTAASDPVIEIDPT